MSLYRFYTYRDKLIIPTVAQAEEGFYMDVAPVTVCNIKDSAQVRSALAETFQVENKVVPTPHPTDEPGSVILELLGLKKWLKFEAEATMSTVHVAGDSIEYYSTGHAINGTWRPQESRHSSFTREGGFEPVLNAIINDVERIANPPPPKAGGLMLLPPSTES